MALGGWSIDSLLYDWILNNLDSNKIILELGSGDGTIELLKNWTVYSIEEDENFVNLHHQNYIHAPIINDWYDTTKFVNLPEKVDLILVDGPANAKRIGFFNNLELFIKLKPSFLIFDDVDREDDYDCYKKVLETIQFKETGIIKDNKKFAYIKL